MYRDWVSIRSTAERRLRRIAKAEVVLALLLALGPVFIGLLVFESTRGLFVGWLRASLSLALDPLLALPLLAIGLNLLGPLLAEVEHMLDEDVYTPGVALRFLVLVLVLAFEELAAVVGAGVVGAAFRLPRPPRRSASSTVSVSPARIREERQLSRAERLAGGLAALERREVVRLASAGRSDDGEGEAKVRRLGSGVRRTQRPRS